MKTARKSRAKVKTVKPTIVLPPSLPPECWIICSSCDEVISSRAATVTHVEAQGAMVRCYVCQGGCIRITLSDEAQGQLPLILAAVPVIPCGATWDGNTCNRPAGHIAEHAQWNERGGIDAAWIDDATGASPGNKNQ